MEEDFLNRYKARSIYELRKIVENSEQYRPEAVRAALQLLQEKEAAKDSGEIIAYPNRSYRDPLDTSFELRPFFSTLGYRDFLTTMTMAVLFLALLEIIKYYSHEWIFEKMDTLYWVTILFLIFLINHSFYKIEHKRSNNFIGRSLNDLILAYAIAVVKILYGFILSGHISSGVTVVNIILFTLGVSFLILFFELGVALLKFIFRRFRWHPF